MLSCRLQLHHRSPLIRFRRDPTGAQLEVIQCGVRVEFQVHISFEVGNGGEHQLLIAVQQERSDGSAPEPIAEGRKGIRVVDTAGSLDIDMVGPVIEEEGRYAATATINGGPPHALRFLAIRG